MAPIPLIGGLGADFMRGGLGDDTFYFDNVGDQASEYMSEGIDTVISTVAIVAGMISEHVDNISLAGTAAIGATGTAIANTIVGNGANNALNGGAGADKLFGLGGNDTYIVDNAADLVDESLAG